jgi:hypothetical protein
MRQTAKGWYPGNTDQRGRRKDEMFNIKNCTRDDILASHRTPSALMGM